MAKKKTDVEKEATPPAPPSPAEMHLPQPEQVEGVEKHRAEDALRDLERAHGHKKDSKLMKAVKKLAAEKKGLYSDLVQHTADDHDGDEEPSSLKEMRAKIRKKAPPFQQ